MTRNITVPLLASVLLAAAGASSAFAYTGQALESGAHVKLSRATAIALRARPGTITDRELEREHGGSGLRYSFDIRAKGVTYEVGVDAMTGRVLENAREGAHPD
ncbi:MAG: PepSY domain-containing protein [Alphaproteobacteria bacterium]|nr:PepSY domain-containing protein [Alphaproteobacteria bacterium]